VDTPATSDQSSRLREQSYPRLPNINQPLLLESSTEANSNPSLEPVGTLAEAKQLLRDLRWEHSSTEGSIARSSEPGEVEEDNWASEEREVEQQPDEVDKEEDDEGDDTEADVEDSDWLNMASSKQPQTITNDNITVLHKKEPRHTSNNYYQEPGRVITIFNGEESHLSCRTMVVMTRSDELALQCVSLCPHPGMTQRDYKKYSTSHVPVYATTGAPTETLPEFKKRIFIEFDSDNTKLLDSCLINCQHVWTIRTGVKYAEEGQVQNFKDLLEAFSYIQKKLYKDVKLEAGLEN
jgi:hypothetical protein